MTTPRLPLRTPAAAAYAQPAVAQTARPAASAANVYAGIDEAKTDTRFPFFTKPGRYLIQTLGWRCQKNQSGKFADVWDIEIVHTYRGEAQPGEKYTRMRVQDQYNTWLTEVKTRAVLMLTAVNYDEAGNFLGPVAAGAVGVETLQQITEGNGEMFVGTPIIAELLPPQPTKGGKEFSPLNLFLPTAQDLEQAGLGG